MVERVVAIKISVKDKVKMDILRIVRSRVQTIDLYALFSY